MTVRQTAWPRLNIHTERPMQFLLTCTAARANQSYLCLIPPQILFSSKKKTWQMWKCPHPGNADALICSLPAYYGMTVTEENPDCSAARCHFSFLCSCGQRSSSVARTSNPSQPASQGGFHIRRHMKLHEHPWVKHYGWILGLTGFATDLIYLLKTIKTTNGFNDTFFHLSDMSRLPVNNQFQ